MGPPPACIPVSGPIFGLFEPREPLFEVAKLREHGVRNRSMSQRSVDDASAGLPDDPPWNTDDGTVVRNGLNHDRTGADPHIAAHSDVAEYPGAASDHDIVAERRVAPPRLLPGSTKRDALVEGHVVADDGRLADHDPHAVVDEEAATYHRARVYLHTREEP